MNVDWETAIHEAAHAVLGWHSQGVTVTGVDLDGAITYMRTGVMGAPAEVTMAGELANYRGADVQGPDWAFDAVALEQTAVESAEIRADEGDEGAVADDASSLFNDWIVRADDRQGLLDFYRAVAIRLLDKHWPAINAVARALIVRRLLDQHALTEMLGEQTAPWWNR